MFDYYFMEKFYYIPKYSLHTFGKVNYCLILLPYEMNFCLLSNASGWLLLSFNTKQFNGKTSDSIWKKQVIGSGELQLIL